MDDGQIWNKKLKVNETYVSEMVKETYWQHLYRCSTLIASRAPRTPTTPSYLPENGMASTWEPVATAPRPASEPTL
jgi:hypothetical protein